MIRLDKPNDPPQVLLNRGNATTQEDCEAYDRNPTVYGTGERKFNFNDGIYGCTEVREVLRTLQHDKCCYCESRPLATSAGRIDHFRPKASVRQRRGADRIHPGYYWMVYRWENLVLACEKCNLKKSDYFPLEDPSQRVRSHHDPLDREAPLLLNPYVETNPGEHLTFDGSACRPETERGRVTVTVLGLNRPELQEERQSVLNTLAILCTVACEPSGCETLRHDARTAMDSYLRASAPYSAMVRDYLSAVDADAENRT